MTAAAQPEPSAALVAEIDAHFAVGIDYDDVAVELMNHAPDVERSFDAMADLVPHLDIA